jgi:uncharacterized protein involved in exopolysaccharide biosynthesis
VCSGEISGAVGECPDLIGAFMADDRTVHRTIVDRFRLLWEERRFLFRVTALGCLLATTIAFLIPRQFEAITELMPPDRDAGSGLASLLAMTRPDGGLGGLAGDLLGLKTSGALFVGILRSHTVEGRIVDQFDLKKAYGVRHRVDARRELENNTQISEDRKSGIIFMVVTDHQPERARDIAHAYVSELDRLVADLNTSSAHRERVFLETRLKSVKQDLDAAAKDFSEFASKNTAIDIQEQGHAMVQAAATLQGQLIAAQSELEALRQIYSDANVRVRSIKARIAELQKKLDQMGGGDLTAAANNAEGSLYPSIRKLPLLGVTYSDLYRRTKMQETLYQVLTQQCELAKVQEAKETPSVKVLDEAGLPEKKSFPPRLPIMVMGTGFAFVAAMFWVFLTATWLETDQQDPGKLLVQEVCAGIRAKIGLVSRNGSRFRIVRDKMLSFRRASDHHGL